MALINSYSKPKVSKKRRSIALLWWPKLSYSPNGSGTEVSGRCKCSTKPSELGTLLGTLRMPSRSSEKQTSRVGMSLNSRKARITIDVRATSPNVPMWGKPLGPYPVSNNTYPFSGGIFSNRFNIRRASSKGQAFDWVAASRISDISNSSFLALHYCRARLGSISCNL